MSLFMSLIGMAVLLGIAVLLSSNRKAINLRTVGGAFAIQFSLGAFILYVPWGQELLRGFSDAVSNVINYGNDGTSFLFGGLVSGKMFEVFGGGGFIFRIPRTTNTNLLLSTDFCTVLLGCYAMGYPHSWRWSAKSTGYITRGIYVCGCKHFRGSN